MQLEQLSHILRKSALKLCDQLQLKTACSATETSSWVLEIMAIVT